MGSTLTTERQTWDSAMASLTAATGLQLPAAAHASCVDTEALWQWVSSETQAGDLHGQWVVAHELQQGLASLLGLAPGSITAASDMATLLPRRQRRALQQQLQSELDWALPRLGLPAWAQTLWGAALLAGFVMQFFWPWIGFPLFWGGMLLSFWVERHVPGLQYPTFGAWSRRVVALNWPSIELGAVDTERMRIAFAEVMRQHFPGQFHPGSAFPTILVHDPWQPDGPATHILNGDALRLALHAVGLDAPHIVMRECLVVGPLVQGPSFHAVRADFIEAAYAQATEKYQIWVADELARLDQLAPGTQVYLWFEDDLFCQVNYWYLLSRLLDMGHVDGNWRVLPVLEADRWAGFARAGRPELLAALEGRILLQPEDLQLGQTLWKAYVARDRATLQALAYVTHGAPWRGLPEALAAAVDLLGQGDGHPVAILRGLKEQGFTTFDQAYPEFQRIAPVFGFGDAQVRDFWKEIRQ